jgi:hypothetical protein
VLPLDSEDAPLVVEAVSRQPVSLRMHRLLVTMIKRREPTGDAWYDAGADSAPPTDAHARAVQTPAEEPRALGDGAGTVRAPAAGRAAVSADSWKQKLAVAPWEEWWHAEAERTEHENKPTD